MFFYNTPLDYSKLPQLYDSFVPQQEKIEQPWSLIQINESSFDVGPVKPVAQLNGSLPDSGKIKPLSKRCRILWYFDTFIEDIKFLEQAIERNFEITNATFQYVYEKQKR